MALDKGGIEEINTLLETLKNVHWLKSNIRWEANFSEQKAQKDKDKALKQFIEKLVVDIFAKIDKIK